MWTEAGDSHVGGKRHAQRAGSGGRRGTPRALPADGGAALPRVIQEFHLPMAVAAAVPACLEEAPFHSRASAYHAIRDKQAAVPYPASGFRHLKGGAQQEHRQQEQKEGYLRQAIHRRSGNGHVHGISPYGMLPWLS